MADQSITLPPHALALSHIQSCSHLFCKWQKVTILVLKCEVRKFWTLNYSVLSILSFDYDLSFVMLVWYYCNASAVSTSLVVLYSSFCLELCVESLFISSFSIILLYLVQSPSLRSCFVFNPVLFWCSFIFFPLCILLYCSCRFSLIVCGSVCLWGDKEQSS